MSCVVIKFQYKNINIFIVTYNLYPSGFLFHILGGLSAASPLKSWDVLSP